jgi:hypothetical protein
MSEGVEDVLDWCDDADLTWRALEGTVYLRLDAEDRDEVRVEQPDGEPMRLHDQVELDADDLSADRLAEVVEDVVLGRSSLVDARLTGEGTTAEVIVVIHPEGLNRHTFLEAVFELQKVRLLLHREVGAARAAAQTVAALAAVVGESA